MTLKNAREIEILREGGKRHAEILRALANMVKPGITTLDLEEEARRLIAEGGDKPAFLDYQPAGARRAFPAALCVSVNEEIVHGIPNENPRTLNEGDIVTIDLGLIHNGLITDAALTVPVGQIDEESARLLKFTKLALEKGLEAAQLGNTIGDIGFAIEKVAERSGFELAQNLAGHGVGYEVHEEPFVPNFGEPHRGARLVPGMVLAVEPMLCVGTGENKTKSDGWTIVTRDGKRSAHFEHTIAITEKGPIILTL